MAGARCALSTHWANGGEGALELADTFCQIARVRVEERFRALSDNADAASYELAQAVLAGRTRGSTMRRGAAGSSF